MSLAPATRIGPYEISATIGAGGMGEIYRARDARLTRDVAIMVLPAALASDADRQRRFEQEAMATARLNHPNILQVFDVGQHEGQPYLVTELLEGETLRRRLEGGALAVRKAIELAIAIASGLGAAHEQGIVLAVSLGLALSALAVFAVPLPASAPGRIVITDVTIVDPSRRERVPAAGHRRGRCGAHR